MSLRICSIIVTFNRKDLLVKNIDAVLNQSFKSDVLIIDNASTDGTEQFLRQKYNFENCSIHYYNTGINIGGSGGFYTGLDIAFKDGNYDYFWLMDDDGRPLSQNTLQKLIDAVPDFSPLDILNSLVVSDDGNTLSFGLSNFHTRNEVTDKYVIGHNNPFNGTLVSRLLVEKIGLPHREFFIGYDEVEYMARCQKNGGQLVTVSESLYYHPQPTMNTYKFLGKTVVSIEGNWKEYYRLRNSIFFTREYLGSYKALLLGLKKIVGSLVFARNGKFRKVSVVYHAFVDGFNGDFSVTDFHITKKYSKKKISNN